MSSSSSVPPFRSLETVRILPVFRSVSSRILSSSAFSFRVSRCENFVLLMSSSKNCLTFMPSRAAIFGFACGGVN